MASMPLLTAAQWLARADEARELAQHLSDAAARETMFGIAEGYERLARHAALWSANGLVLDQSDNLERE
jgi:hypothetical protein